MMRRRFAKSDADWLIKVDADSIIVREEVGFEDILDRYPGKDIYFPADIFQLSEYSPAAQPARGAEIRHFAPAQCRLLHHPQ